MWVSDSKKVQCYVMIEHIFCLVQYFPDPTRASDGSKPTGAIVYDYRVSRNRLHSISGDQQTAKPVLGGKHTCYACCDCPLDANDSF